MRQATCVVMTEVTIAVVLIPLKGIDNVKCVSLALNVTAINWVTVTLLIYTDNIHWLIKTCELYYYY